MVYCCKCSDVFAAIYEKLSLSTRRTVLWIAEHLDKERLYWRQTGEVADRPPLLIAKSRRRRYQLKFGNVDRRRYSDGQDGDISLVSGQSFWQNRQRSGRWLAVGDQNSHARHARTFALDNNNNNNYYYYLTLGTYNPEGVQKLRNTKLDTIISLCSL